MVPVSDRPPPAEGWTGDRAYARGVDQGHEVGGQPGIEVELSPTASTAPPPPRSAGRRRGALAAAAVLAGAVLISGAGGRLRAGDLGPFAGPELTDGSSDGGRIRTRGADWTIARQFGSWSVTSTSGQSTGEVEFDDELAGGELEPASQFDDERIAADEFANSDLYDDDSTFSRGSLTRIRPFPRAGSSTATSTRPPSVTTARPPTRATSPATPRPTPTTPPTGPAGPPSTNPPASNRATGATTTSPPATSPPATNPPATNPPATNPPATDPRTTDPPATDPTATTTTASSTTTTMVSPTSTTTTSTTTTTTTSTSTTSTTLPSSNVLDVLRADPDFSDFVAAIDEFQLADELEGSESVTVLAVTNDVLGALAPLDAEQLRRHLLAASWTRAALLEETTVSTIDEGVALTVDATVDPPTVGGVELLEEELPASNGRVLVVGGLVAPAAD